MPALLLKFKDKMLRQYDLDDGISLKIGRHRDNDVVIENLAVSGHHAKVDSVGEEFLFTDLKSKNGSFRDDKRIDLHWLKNHDAITIGKHIIEFIYKRDEQIPVDTVQDMNQTMIMDTAKYRDMIKKSENDRVFNKRGCVGMISFIAGGDGDIELSKKLVKIGKNSSSDIVVNGFTVGKTCATVSKRPDGYYLSFVKGLAKPKLNGRTVKDSMKLKEFDVIAIGSTRLQFLLKKQVNNK